MKRRPLVFLAACILLAACSSTRMLPGRIVRSSDGVLLQMKIELSPGGKGIITATDPVTKEKFKGEYTAVRGKDKTDLAPTKAYLVGDQGTTVTLDMQIEPGDPPKGIGDGVDNKGRRYQLQF